MKVTRRFFLKIFAATSAAAYTGAVTLKLLKPCPLCEASFAHIPESIGYSCRWRELNARYKGIVPKPWQPQHDEQACADGLKSPSCNCEISRNNAGDV